MHEIFLDELKKLNTRFMEMGVLVNDLIDKGTRSFVAHDKMMAQEMIEEDKEVAKEAIKIEKKALDLMALQQPVATDFRVVISILKATTDLERIGENANSIAVETVRVKGNPRISEVEEIISRMTHQVRSMLIKVLTAYVQEDEKTAREMVEGHKEVYDDYKKARKMIIDGVEQDPNVAVASASYFVIIRLLERISDHIVNIANWVIYKVSGELFELIENKNN
ncbi:MULTISPECIES: phosphate signaling complex protein PhoU [Lactobacillus]|uniref:Phosphate-specific transport system accessory protein PhoU n=1 Tax=Lactobacillus bombicola TaxID=1505723 RepID=A0A396STJ1_9LACO|nr:MULTISPECIES: phosphate signaling complex protein PhoU [Lactobacillus]RHW51440.1 phosphate transport system regulatory protein PhoU [Lactobacillus bombicola]RHW52526.1 phosphate transport system regulatory protein PhoU [Lactobacillus bombicola]RHW53980.1 phosphate transport system regulatory protein PhoU [Lactobacillus bombicola]RMC45224.1 phosphate signaling complex protein PhoU [Lactobacillus sp. ESL0230]